MELESFLDKHLLKIRIGIYSSGLLLLGFVVYMNVFKIETNRFLLVSKTDPLNSFYEVPIQKPATSTTMHINLKSSDLDLGSFRLKISRTLSPMLRQRANTLTKVEDIKEVLFKGNASQRPNGSILEFDGAAYLLEEGKLRLIESEIIFEKLGFDWDNIQEISETEFSSFPLEKNINESNVSRDEYPSGVIIKSGEDYFITGAKNIYPILSPGLIQEVWPEYNFVETGSSRRSRMQDAQCSIIDKNKIYCEASLKDWQKIPGNIYSITTEGIPGESIENIEMTTLRLPNWDSINQETKKLLW